MIFEYKKKVYGYECDVYGHLNNANYLQIYEAARAEALIEMRMPIAKLKEMNVMLFLVKAEIEYKKGVELEAVVTVKSKIIENNRLKSLWQQEIFNPKGELCSRVIVTGAYVSDGKATRISKELCDFFDGFVEV